MIHCKLLGDPGAGLPPGKPLPGPPREFLELAAGIPIIPQVQANEALQLLKAGRLGGAGALKVGKQFDHPGRKEVSKIGSCKTLFFVILNEVKDLNLL